MRTNFNSIKVQLEHSVAQVSRPNENKFQFHKGTIRTSGNSVFVIQNVRNFNSIKVQLEQTSQLLKASTLLYFNSIKVQLELVSLSGRSTIHHFNSIKVQLEPVNP